MTMINIEDLCLQRFTLNKMVDIAIEELLYRNRIFFKRYFEDDRIIYFISEMDDCIYCIDTVSFEILRKIKESTSIDKEEDQQKEWIIINVNNKFKEDVAELFVL